MLASVSNRLEGINNRIWKLRKRPVLSATITFAVMFGALGLLRQFAEGGYYVKRWTSFKYGDSIALPLATYFGGKVLWGYYPHKKSFLDTWQFAGIVYVLSETYSVLLEANAVRTKFIPLEGELQVPSQLYHTIMFGFVAAYLVPTLVAVVRSESSRDKKLCLLFVTLYVALLIYDVSPLQDKTPMVAPHYL